MGKYLLFNLLVLVSYPLFALEIDLTAKESMFGTGEALIPCAFAGVNTQCKLDTGVLFSRSHGIELPNDLELINMSTTTSVSGETMQCPFLKVETVSVGTGPQKLTHNNMGSVNCPQIKGRPSLLGLDFFWKKVFSIDMKKQKLGVDLEPLDPALAQPFVREVSEGSIIIAFDVGKKNTPTVAFFDSGATMTLVSKEFVKNHPENFTIISTQSVAKDIFGNEITNDLAIIGHSTFQGHKVIAEYVMVVDFTDIKKNYGEDVEFIVGMNWINNLKWTFDLEQNLFIVED